MIEVKNLTHRYGDRVVDCGLDEELLVTVSVEIRFPREAGVNVTVMLQVSPAPNVLGLIGQFPPKA